MGIRTYFSAFLFSALAGLTFTGCSIGGSTQTSQPVNPDASYSIGGTVSGLSGTGLVLVDNGTDNLAISANGAFTFPTQVEDLGNYLVTVFAQPSNPAQSCVVTNGGGGVLGNVTNVQVTCTTIASPPTPPVTTTAGEWTWMGGSNLANQVGVYGELGLGAAGNIPGAREGAVGWTDLEGNFWLSGGTEIVGASCALTHALCWLVSANNNDLWKYSEGEWTWMGGSNESDQPGVYGTQGVGAPANVPGARAGASSWTDAQGNFWLFGGGGDENNSGVLFNDLWKYSEGEWAWVSGSNAGAQPGVYGTLGQAASGNVPGSRSGAVSWIDKSGNLWLFGGSGCDSTSSCGGNLNDLWKFSGGQWAWMSGSNVSGHAGVYGTRGQTAPGNSPGAREGAVGWTDASGNLWLFGGYGAPAIVTAGSLNDLWEYSGGQWAWMGGSDLAFQAGIYGTQGTAAPSNTPGTRQNAVTWTDAAGKFWLFGGIGIDSTGQEGELNDLWKYSAGEWTWVSGSNLANPTGSYGTLGTPSPTNQPLPRDTAISWIDSSGNLWLFGGDNSTAGSISEQLNDLWVYQP